MVNRSDNPRSQILQDPEGREPKPAAAPNIFGGGFAGTFSSAHRQDAARTANPNEVVANRQPTSVEAAPDGKNWLKTFGRVAMVGIPLAIFAPIGLNLMNPSESPNIDTDPLITDPVVSNPELPLDPIEPSAEPTVSTPEQTSPANLNIPFDSGEAVIGENEFDISDEKYAELVDRYSINLPSDAKPEQVLAVASGIIADYYASGHSLKDREEHGLYGSTGGWNQWATAVNTDALVNGLFVDGYNDEGNSNSNIPNLEEWKTEANRIWINTVKASETPYKVDVDFTPEDIQATANFFTATGTYVLSSNAAESPTAASDSKSFVNPEKTNVKFVIAYNNSSTNPGWEVTQMNKTQ